MTSKCLVTFRERNFVLPFDGTLTRRGLVERVGDHELFRGIDVATLIFTMFEEDFNVFVDIPEDFEIRDRAKIKVSEDCQVRYPGKLYNEAAQALVSRYPNLADSSGTGY
ncbi:hypothetical protein V5799_013446, partial [Amblyomma americanum]